MNINPLAGKPAPKSMLVNIAELITAYYTRQPDVSQQAQRVAFGTSGHRGSSLLRSFNEAHIQAITQAVCDYRREEGIHGTLFMGIDTHALSWPAQLTALQVMVANKVDVYIAADFAFTPTQTISHAILTHNRDGEKKCDGIIITPSHNPPTDGGFKYNPPHGGPAGAEVTNTIQDRANAILEGNLKEVRRVLPNDALKSEYVHHYDFMTPYVEDMDNVIDMEVIANSKIRIGADVLGGAGMLYYDAIKKRYGLNIEIFHDNLDQTFSFMRVDWDGKIRMDPSSPYAMAGLVEMKDNFDVSFGNDTDFDRHGIVAKSTGLMNPNHYLSVAINYLSENRPLWKKDLGIGKTLVSSSIIDRVAASLDRKLVEVPVGFKWFVDGLLNETIFFGGEESAGASFLRKDGTTWTTDKDGIILTLLAAEITAKTGRDPGVHYKELTDKFGTPIYERIDAPATPEQKAILQNLDAKDVKEKMLAGEPIKSILTNAPGNGAPIGGLKVVTENGWFALRPSGTENIYKIYAESFIDEAHLTRIQDEAQAIVKKLF